MAQGAVFPDPNVEHGAFRVLPRTDGGYIIVDTRRPPGRQTVGEKFRNIGDAAVTAKTWHDAGHG